MAELIAGTKPGQDRDNIRDNIRDRPGQTGTNGVPLKGKPQVVPECVPNSHGGENSTNTPIAELRKRWQAGDYAGASVGIVRANIRFSGRSE